MTENMIDESHRVVGMMGVEPFQKAITSGAQIILAGRATDASIYSAIPLMKGFDPGLCWHLSKNYRMRRTGYYSRLAKTALLVLYMMIIS